MAGDLVFLIDVDNTLFDNDAFKGAITAEARRALGQANARLFWDLYEQVRRETETVDLPGTLRLLAAAGHAAESARISEFLEGYDFAGGLYPDTLDTLRYLEGLGDCVILSDGDQVFQRYKIARSGLQEAVGGDVLVYVHKQDHLDEVARLYPARHYIMVDDKATILEAIKDGWSERVTTLFVRQGHYAAEALARGAPRVDLDIQAIGDARTLSAADYGGAPAR